MSCNFSSETDVHDVRCADEHSPVVTVLPVDEAIAELRRRFPFQNEPLTEAFLQAWQLGSRSSSSQQGVIYAFPNAPHPSVVSAQKGIILAGKHDSFPDTEILLTRRTSVSQAGYLHEVLNAAVVPGSTFATFGSAGSEDGMVLLSPAVDRYGVFNYVSASGESRICERHAPARLPREVIVLLSEIREVLLKAARHSSCNYSLQVGDRDLPL
jgi:hypothetical protein